MKKCITLGEAIELARYAHDGQYRRPVKVFPQNEHTLTNYEITQLQQNNGSDFSICKEDGEYTMDIHLQLFIAKPYITHPLAVMNMMNTEEEKIIAVLHDVFEQCEGYALCRIMDDSRFYIKIRSTLEEYDITYNMYAALTLLSKYKNDTYGKYINELVSKQFIYGLKDLRPNILAAKIKIADITHNMSETDSDKQKQKYLEALPRLLKIL